MNRQHTEILSLFRVNKVIARQTDSTVTRRIKGKLQ